MIATRNCKLTSLTGADGVTAAVAQPPDHALAATGELTAQRRAQLHSLRTGEQRRQRLDHVVVRDGKLARRGKVAEGLGDVHMLRTAS